MSIERDPGSYRDPSGYVFFFEGQVYRALDEETFDVLRQLDEQKLLDALAGEKLTIRTRLLSESDPIYAQLKSHLPNETHFVHHERIPTISFPCEWTISMLADAAALYLKLQIQLISHGFSLKDGSAYNIQFVGSRPIFIDLPSIERPGRRDVWVGYNQFCRMFLYPLMLAKHLGMDLKGYFLANINGLEVDRVYRLLGRSSFRPSLMIDVGLPYLLGKTAKKRTEELKQSIRKEGGDPAPLVMNLKRLIRKIGKYAAPKRTGGHWIDYVDTNTYTDEAEEEKVRFVQAVLDEAGPDTVLDLGCNTGRYSLLSAEAAENVIAVDFDHDCVDLIYRQCRDREKNVLPLWLDLSNPSPAIGFRNRERPSFLQRIGGDCVLALALVHHLLITARVPLEGICDVLSDLTRRHLIVEYIDREDEMFQSLLALSEDLYQDLTLERFTSVFSDRFEVVRTGPLPGVKRTLLWMKKKV